MLKRGGGGDASLEAHLRGRAARMHRSGLRDLKLSTAAAPRHASHAAGAHVDQCLDLPSSLPCKRVGRYYLFGDLGHNGYEV